jgi:hypothetical protein
MVYLISLPLQFHVVVKPVHQDQLVTVSHLLLCECLVRVQPRRVQADLMFLGDLPAFKISVECVECGEMP